MRPLYRLYTRVLRRQLAGLPMPQHVAIVMDGNRRWARQAAASTKNPVVGRPGTTTYEWAIGSGPSTWISS